MADAKKREAESNAAPPVAGVDYKRKLQLWASRRNGVVSIATISKKPSPNSNETKPFEFVEITCSFLAHKCRTEKLDNETYDAAEQRAARNFLRVYAAAPFK